MTFNGTHERHMNNLNDAHDALLEALDEEELIRERILEDESLFQRLAKTWLDDPIQREGFLDWGIEQVKKERAPKYTKGWQKDPLGYGCD